MTLITQAQYNKLVEGIAPSRIGTKQGQSHVEAWDIRRHLIRIFGFGGFDIETLRCELVKEIETPPDNPKGKIRWTVIYRAEVRLTIKTRTGQVIARYEDGATGDGCNQPSCGDAHDLAMKTALSQALKRCAVNLGDQFGMALYNGGKPAAVVQRSLIAPEVDSGPPATPLPVDDAPVMPEPAPAAEQEEPEPAPAQPAAPPEQAPPDTVKATPTAASVRDWVLQPRRTITETAKAAAKLELEHPAIAAATITNEHGDEEQLRVFLARHSGQAGPITAKQSKRLHALLGELGASRDQKLAFLSELVGRQVETSAALTVEEANRAIDACEARRKQHRAQPAQPPAQVAA